MNDRSVLFNGYWDDWNEGSEAVRGCCEQDWGMYIEEDIILGEERDVGRKRMILRARIKSRRHRNKHAIVAAVAGIIANG